MALARILYIHYLLHFWKDNQNEMRALIDSSSKVNAMTPAYTSKLGFRIRQINVGAQKIDGFTLKTFRIVLASS